MNPTSPIVRNFAPPADQMPPLTEAMRAAMAQTPVSTEQVDAYLQEMGVGVDQENTKQLILALREGCNAWRSITSANNLYTAYQAPNGEKSEFNRTSRRYLDSYLTARTQIDSEIPR